MRLGDHLVLARRRWSVPRALFPRRTAGEGDFEHFARVQRWRREHDLPREVFLSLFPAHPWAVAEPPPPKPEAAAEPGGEPPAPDEARPAPPRRRGHPHKPQYVDFDNPLLVDLFGRALENLEELDAYLYERLPAAEHAAAAGDERYVTELVVQVDVRRDLALDSPSSAGGSADG